MRVVDRRDGKSHIIAWNDEIAALLAAVEEKYNCKHAAQEVRQFGTSNGGTQIRRQCVSCGAKTSNAIGKSQVQGEIPSGDESLAAKWDGNRAAEKDDVTQSYLELQIRRETSFRKRYDSYLKSEKWKAIRIKVMKRAGGICEGCLESAAVQIHHLSYNNFQNEFMFQLVALCSYCHDRTHQIGAYEKEGDEEPDNGLEDDLELPNHDDI